MATRLPQQPYTGQTIRIITPRRQTIHTQPTTRMAAQYVVTEQSQDGDLILRSLIAMGLIGVLGMAVIVFFIACLINPILLPVLILALSGGLAGIKPRYTKKVTRTYYYN